MFTRQDFRKSNRFAAWRHALHSLLGLLFAYFLYGASLFVIGVGHMNPKRPDYYGWLSATTQLLPLLISALCWLLFLWSYKTKWLLLAIGGWLSMALSIPVINHLLY